MKSTLVLLAILLAASGLSDPAATRSSRPVSPAAGAPTVRLSPSPRLTASWDDVHDYIVAHATNPSASVEARLKSESLAGLKTWEVRPTPVPLRDGGSLGWPREGALIVFATLMEAQTCAGMIDEFRAAMGPITQPGSSGLAPRDVAPHVATGRNLGGRG